MLFAFAMATFILSLEHSTEYLFFFKSRLLQIKFKQSNEAPLTIFRQIW